jgi:hypothetical protein
MVALFEEVVAEVFFWEVVDGQMSSLVQYLHPPAIGDGLAVKDRPHPLGAVLEVQGVGLQHRGVEVERTTVPLTKRAGSFR